MPRVLYDAEKTFSDFPARGTCLSCGKPFKNPRQKFCHSGCRWTFYEKEILPHARVWVHFRRVIFERDGWRCKHCGNSKRHELEAHHIIPLSEGGAEYDPNNCMTLCRDCHDSGVHSKRHIRKIRRLMPPDQQLAAAAVLADLSKQKTLAQF